MNKNDLQKVGSAFICGFEGETLTKELKELINSYHIGGVILFSHNLKNEEQIKKLTRDIKNEAINAGYNQEILIAIDQENGLVNRLKAIDFFMPGAMSLAASNDEALAYEVGYVTANKLKNLGINFNLAPVLDLNTNPQNPGVGTRSFSDKATLASRMSENFIKAHLDNGILCAAKHFPGLGNLSTDTHYSLPEVDKSYEDLVDFEMIPFKNAIDKGIPVVMTAHVRFPQIDNYNVPATMSKIILTDILRGKLEFEGVIITDCLEMGAISENYGVEEGARKAILAGANLLIVSHSPKAQIKAINAIAKAYENDLAYKEILEESFERISKIKEILNNTEKSLKVGRPEEFYKKTVSILKFERKLGDKVIALVPFDERRSVGENKNIGREQVLKELINEKLPGIKVYEYYKENFLEQFKRAIKENPSYQIILGTINNNFNINKDDLVDISKKEIRLYVISLRDPYPNKILYNLSSAWINTYEVNRYTASIGIDCLMVGKKANGKLPLDLYLRD